MTIYRFKECKDCHAPLYWDNDVRSERTGNRIPLNSDGTKHFTTCTANSYRNEQWQKEQQQQPMQQPQKEAIPIAGPRQDDWETRLGLLNGQIFVRLDRIDKSIMKISNAIERLAEYFERNEKGAMDDLRYDQDREEGLA